MTSARETRMVNTVGALKSAARFLKGSPVKEEVDYGKGMDTAADAMLGALYEENSNA